MKPVFVGSVTWIAVAVAVPTRVAAHGGHWPDHGWLEGALQPLLGADHLLAALFVVGIGAVVTAVAGAARARARREAARG